MSRYAPKPMPSGAVLQAGLPFAPGPGTQAHGLLVRGVVVATYVYDDPGHPFANDQPAAIYCDVLVYTQLTGGRTYLLKNVLVSQEYASMQGGVIYHPRAATQTISGAPLDPSEVIDPAQLDGDHVLVGFIDDRRHQPVILRMLPPPNSDIGHAGDPLGHRTRLTLVDGQPWLLKCNGAFLGFDGAGNWVVDTTQANDGGIDATGREIPSPGGGALTQRGKLTGGFTTQLIDPATGEAAITQSLGEGGLSVSFGTLPGAISITGAQGNVLTIPAASAGTAAVQIGAGTASLVSAAQLLKYFSQQLIPWLTTHTHSGPGTPPNQLPVPQPSGAIANANLQVPGN